MTTGFSGSQFRLYPWQVKHYLARGGPFDPVLQTSGIQGALTGGYLNVNTTVTLPPVPGTQTPPAVPLPRVQNMFSSTAALTVTTGNLATVNGGIYLGTLPGGAWIDDLEIYCYTALSGGTSTSVGIFYVEADQQGAAPGFQPATMNLLGFVTSPAAGTSYIPGVATFSAAVNSVTTVGGLRGLLTGYQLGPGTGPTGSTWPTINNQTLASNGPPGGEGFAGIKDLLAGGAASTPGDIDLYFVNFLIAGGGTVNTAGNFAIKVGFTGLMG